MRSGPSSARVIVVIALGALVTMGCGQTNHSGAAPQGTTSAEPNVTSCGIGLCNSSPPTSTSPATNDTTTTPWVAATANLAGLPSECGNMSLMSARPDRDMLIAGVAQQGLWASQNGSAAWTRLGQGTGS